MTDITITTIIGQDRRLVIDLPENIPPGQVEIVIRSVKVNTDQDSPLTRQQIQAKLATAGILSEANYSDEPIIPLSPEEEKRLAQIFSGDRSSEELINEERGPY